MHNSYTSSTLWSFRAKGSVSISFNDCSSLLNPKLDNKTPSHASSHCCSCCSCSCSCCSALYARRVAVSPSTFYGLRQSNFIQRSPARRFVLCGGNGCYSDYEFSSSLRGRRSSGGKVKCMALEERSSRYWLSGVPDVEDVLSLLSDQVDDECLGTTESYRRLSRRVGGEKRRDYATKYFRERRSAEVKKKSDCDSEQYVGKKIIVKVEEGSGCNVHHREKEKKDVSDRLENVSRHDVRSVAINFGKERHGRTEETESLRKTDNHKQRTKSSSCSSYYSLSSNGDFESDTETLEKEDKFLEESFAEKEKVSVRHEASRVEGKVEQTSIEDGGGEEGYNMVGSSCHWDLRKKSEKKLDEVGTEEMQSTKKSSEVRSRIRKAYDTEHVKESGYSTQYDHEDYSNYTVNSSQSTRKKDIQVRNKVSQRSDSHQDISKVSKQSETQTKHQHISEGSDLWSESNFGARDERTSSNRVSKTTRMLNDNTERFASQRNSESQLNSHEEKEQRRLMESKAHQKKQFSEGSQEMTSISIHSVDVDNAVSSHGSKEKIMFERESNLKRETKLVGETSHGYQETSENVMEMKSGKKSSKSGSVRKSREKADGSFSIQVSMVSQSTEQQVRKVEAEKRSTQAILMPPPSQLIASGSVDENMIRIAAHEASGITSESGSSTKYLTSGGTSSEFQESSGESRDQRLVEPLKVPSPEDSLGSAHRLEESSVHFVGEFVERVRHEVSTSETQKETTSSVLKLVDEADMHGHGSSKQFVKDSSQRRRSESRQSSEGSGARGPSEEVWHVTETSAEEPHEAEIPEASSTGEQTVVKRNGRSLWNVMVDVLHLRWGSRATSSSSAARSGGRTSPNESARSEALFSGCEIEENQKGERTNVPQDSISHHLEPGKTSGQLQGEVSGLKRMATNKEELGKNVSLTPHVSETFHKDNFSVHVEVNQGTDGFPGVTEVTESSAPLPSSSVRPVPVIEKITSLDEIGATVSGSMESKENLQAASLVEVSPGSQAKGGELRPRKLQRTKQVPRDRFDEWEEAYKLETEQRKVDEMFMREALLEAKKAADVWEVPVGAVLVQHGKIIARGYNLVEELRDSTAHAEMICIREASNQLRSWRLADATLYVTLEPCPMCAGAILQARIDTLVWGAPNKLLGADGSWIRLFPDGEGGNNSDKPAPPVHRFHPKMNIRRGVIASDCSDVMQRFFQLRRKKKKEVEKSPPPSCLPVPSHPSKLLNKMHGVLHFMFCL